MSEELDSAVRAAAFQWLDQLKIVHGDTLPYETLRQGFDFRGTRVPLLGPPGIFKPAVLDTPLSILTAAPKRGEEAPYADQVTEEGLLSYRYRGTNADHHDNMALRRAYERGAPLVYLYGVTRAEYVAIYPVQVVADNRKELAFLVDLAPGAAVTAVAEESPHYGAISKAYSVSSTMRRLHQARFRRNVIAAYGRRCAICRLGHDELLNAAHILPDRDPRSLPVVPNGLALCTLHHPAFDRHLIGIRPDLHVELRQDILDEEDGPLLIHGLQGFHGQVIGIPRSRRDRPNPEFLEERYELFKAG